MPPVPSPAHALVTGANGYLGTWLVHALIEHGYYVRGTVRTLAKGKIVKEGLGDLGGKFEYVIVGDVLKDSAFDDAVEGTQLVMHTLSPLFLSNKADEIIPPAVAGTLNLLKSAQKHQSTVRRVVITGSICAVLSWPTITPRTYDETSVNEASIQAIEAGSVDPVAIYCAAKTQSESGAWVYLKDQNITEFDVVYLHGSYFFGPYSHPVSSISDFGESVHCLHTIVTQGRLNNGLLETGTGWIDVRDIALAHVLAGQKEEAGGQCIIISAGDCVVDDLNKMACSLDSSLKGSTDSVLKENRYMFDTSKMRRVLGLEPRPPEASPTGQSYNTPQNLLNAFVLRAGTQSLERPLWCTYAWNSRGKATASGDGRSTGLGRLHTCTHIVCITTHVRLRYYTRAASTTFLQSSRGHPMMISRRGSPATPTPPNTSQRLAFHIPPSVSCVRFER